MSILRFQSLVLLMLFLACPERTGHAYEPPNTPVDAALAQGKLAFIGKLISSRPIEKSEGIETVEGQFEVLYPLYGSVPAKNEKVAIRYHTLYNVIPCLDFDEIPAGTVVLFVFRSDPIIPGKVFELYYCWGPTMDLAYKIRNPLPSYESGPSTISLSLISGSWAGEISLVKLRAFASGDRTIH